ncbi:MAG: type 1 glutamine amidotransferase [Burkholderiales bacterium]
MKPIAIFRHFPTEGPGYFASFLSRRTIPYQLIKVDKGETIPTDPTRYSAFVFMGGPMSVNDELPWISEELELIRRAVVSDVPVLGHCLGGQLMAKALGGTVARNPVKEIGWGKVKVSDHPLARKWFGDVNSFISYHWHGESFSLPEQAARILSSDYCENQAFCLGKHLAMQCHVEMTEEMVRAWAKAGAQELAKPTPSVQGREDMLENLADKIAGLNRVADKLYTRWIAGLKY